MTRHRENEWEDVNRKPVDLSDDEDDEEPNYDYYDEDDDEEELPQYKYERHLKELIDDEKKVDKMAKKKRKKSKKPEVKTEVKTEIPEEPKPQPIPEPAQPGAAAERGDGRAAESARAGSKRTRRCRPSAARTRTGRSAPGWTPPRRCCARPPAE